jgi:AcrR family transcriptional regulator
MRSSLQTKERIERAALRLFVEQGVAETSIRDIAAAAGVSQGAMYNHYASKEELAFGLFAQIWSDMGSELRRSSHSGDTLEAKFEAMVRFVFERFDRDWVLVTYVFVERHRHMRRLAANLPNPYLVFRSVIVDAMRRGEIPRQHPDLANAMVIGAIIQVIDTRIYGRIKQNLSGLSGQVAKSCAAMLRG